MTFKITKSKVCMALIVAFCVLAVAFAAIVLPRGAASAEEAADDAKVTFGLTESDFADYDGTGEENRLWLLQTDDAAVSLGDKYRYT
ncbi:MAG: hypothetical protein K2L88_00580, partial [Clostridiales bacterium]|nr:hypothetical protein [Clostridiales bacterium]